MQTKPDNQNVSIKRRTAIYTYKNVGVGVFGIAMITCDKRKHGFKVRVRQLFAETSTHLPPQRHWLLRRVSRQRHSNHLQVDIAAQRLSARAR